MSIVLGGDIKGAYCGGDVRELWLGGTKVWKKSPANVVRIGGRDYPFVGIGGKYWLAESLDFAFDGLEVGNAGTSSSTPQANYYDNDGSTYGVNGNKYGLLYNWYAVKLLNDNRSSLLPQGWRVPATEELRIFTNLDTSVIKAETGWNYGGNGNNSSGFGGCPAGRYYHDDVAGSDHFSDLGTYLYLWSSDEYTGGGYGDAYGLSINPGKAASITGMYRRNQVSIRLVKDI